MQIYGQTHIDTNTMNLIQKLFCEFPELGTESRSKRHQQNMTIHCLNFSVKLVRQRQDKKKSKKRWNMPSMPDNYVPFYKIHM